MNNEFSDAELTAFLDGVAEPGPAARIDAAAKADPLLQARLEALELNTLELKNAFDPMLGVARSRNLEHKLDCAISKDAANDTSAPRGLVRYASHAAALAIGAAIGWAFLMPADDWRAEVAHYQALYVSDTLTPITPDANRLASEFNRASEALGLAIEPGMFDDIPGLKLHRAQILGFNGTPLVQIAFTQPDGTPVAFCILRDAGNATSPQSDTLVGLAAASWETPTHRFLTIGGTDISVILALANQLKQRL